VRPACVRCTCQCVWLSLHTIVTTHSTLRALTHASQQTCAFIPLLTTVTHCRPSSLHASASHGLVLYQALPPALLQAVQSSTCSVSCHSSTQRCLSLYFFQLGMILYTADVAQRFTTKLHTASGTASAACDSSSERVVVLRATAASLCSESMAGRFFYVQVPAISKLEWHPLCKLLRCCQWHSHLWHQSNRYVTTLQLILLLVLYVILHTHTVVNCACSCITPSTDSRATLNASNTALHSK
jgi:hypothetical protein